MLRALVAETEGAGVPVLCGSVVGNKTHRPLSVMTIFTLAHDLADVELNVHAARYRSSRRSLERDVR